MTEPVLPGDLEREADNPPVPPDWYARVLISLAAQLGAGNDFYYPLLGASALLQPQPNPRKRR